MLRKRIELSAVRKGGEEFPIELSITPVGSATEVKFLGFIRDISDRRRTEEMIIREAREATLVGQLTALAAGQAGLDEVLRECLAAVCELTSWPLGHAYLPSEAQPIQLHPTGIWHPTDYPQTAFKQLTEQSIFEPGIGLPGHVWAAQEPVWVREMPDDPTYPRTKEARAMQLTSAFGFPLFVHGRIAAIFEFFNADKTPPSASTLLLVRTLGDQVGRVLERRASEESMRQEIGRRERLEKHQELLLAEMNHRVKNMLAVVIGIANQTARSTSTFEAFKEGYSARLHALSRGYQLLTERNWRSASLTDLIAEVVAPHVGDAASQLRVNGRPLHVPPKQSLALSMIFHELTTNAVKYGALSANGAVEISWNLDGPKVQLRWREYGLGDLKPPTKTGFGNKLIQASARHELRGAVTFTYHPRGVECCLSFPVDDEWRE
ncbi:MAG: hypothetical protein JWL62_3785 [Hyphomicrobiales bacterium]|nr:hypothetical protein [Hyphomicrobiales bacterium]